MDNGYLIYRVARKSINQFNSYGDSVRLYVRPSVTFSDGQ